MSHNYTIFRIPAHFYFRRPFKIGDEEFVVQFKAVSDADNGAVNIIYVQNTKTGQAVYTAVPPGHETANAFAIQQAESMLKSGLVPP